MSCCPTQDKTACCPTQDQGNIEGHQVPTTQGDCCSGQEVTEVVRAGYADVSKKSAGRTEEEEAAAHKLAMNMGYTEEELSHVPAEANMGLQCGNCVSLAKLQPGETVVDLGSGGGFDIFIASRRVGPTGRCIGIDMTPEMVEQATKSAEKRGIKNTEFHLANIAKMDPIPDNSVDVIISNCVINLCPSKEEVFREMYRILKPGGRIALSDVLLTDKELPAAARKSINLLVGCVAGSIPAGQYLKGLKDAGFKTAELANGGQDLNGMWNPDKQANGGCCCAVDVTDVDDSELKGLDMNDFVFSAKVTGTK